MAQASLVEGIEAPLRVVQHQCRRCQVFFRYQYDVNYSVERLSDIDFICNGCLADFVQAVEAGRTIA